jgi:nucleoside-diphosphate-sugar epimerase
MAKVLVTGATGTLGREIVSRLIAKHFGTRVLSHNSKPSASEWIEVHFGDLASGEGLRQVTKVPPQAPDQRRLCACKLASADNGCNGPADKRFCIIKRR